MKPPRATEDQIQASIVEWLRMQRGCTPIKIHNEGKRSPRGGARLKRLGLHPGAADLVVRLPAKRSLFIECKTEIGRLSPEQKQFRTECEEQGHEYIVARDLETVIAYLSEAA